MRDEGGGSKFQAEGLLCQISEMKGSIAKEQGTKLNAMLAWRNISQKLSPIKHMKWFKKQLGSLNIQRLELGEGTQASA